MIQDFKIIHRRKPHVFNDPSFPVWSTCLRSLAFVSSEYEAQPGDEVYSQQAAYQFLLETICGLKSPIVGETEVFGQFKVFSQQWLKSDPSRVSLVQRLLNDAKVIRNLYLSHLGTQSYGSWVRKNLKLTNREVHFIGAGILAQEILPYVVKAGFKVRVHARDINKIDFHSERQVFAADGFTEGAVIIAAPVLASEVARFIGAQTASQIFDLRETAATDILDVNGEIFALHQIFAEIEKTKLLLAPRLKEVRREIEERSAKAFDHALLRPQGWDDLCA